MYVFFNKILTHLFLIVYNPVVLKLFYFNKTKKLSELKDTQLKNLKQTLIFSYENVPFYKSWFDRNEFNPYEFNKLSDLEQLPILNKNIIKENMEEFETRNNKSNGCKLVATGGSTGAPFKYFTSKASRNLSFALLLKGWALGGYRIGDSVVVLAGGSLVPKKDSKISIIKNRLLNFHKFSTYGVDMDDLYDYYIKINKLRPKFIRGYASSMYLFAEYLQKNNLKLNRNVVAVFTTAEMLPQNQRQVIEAAFNSRVYDGYGLNDGGLTAFECEYHDGYHIDTERGYLEVVDEDGKLVSGREGMILATTLMEKCMPLIRYDTGDLGVLADLACSCSNQKPILKELKGRVTDSLKINNRVIASPVLTVLMGKTDAVNYQIEQVSADKIIFHLVYTDKEKIKGDIATISNSLRSKLGEISIEIDICDSIYVEPGKKHKFIINNSDVY